MTSRALRPADLPAVRRLAAAVRAEDGLELKLEWAAIVEGRATGFVVEDPERPEEPAGFLGFYPFGIEQVELCGMVAPTARRRGIAGGLLDVALALADERAIPRRLLIVPRSAVAAQRLARSRALGLDHSEHSMRLTHRPDPPELLPGLALRPATAADRPALVDLITRGFGRPPQFGMVDHLDGGARRTMIVTLDERPVGTLRLSLEGTEGGVYGFTVDPGLQGRGIGGFALAAGCIDLFDSGARSVRLEVEVQNDRALGLYERAGFRTVSTEDYYRLPGPV